MVLHYAHRGGGEGRQRENTLGAFRACLRRGWHGFECDVRRSADGTLVVVHDSTLRRTHDVARRTRDLSESERRAHGIPTLDEVLAAFPRTFMVLDIKERGCMHRIATLCDQGRIDPRYHILLVWSDAWPQPRGSVCFRARETRFPVGAHAGVACKYSGSPPNLAAIRRARNAGKPVNLFTKAAEKEAEMVAFARRLGCSVTTDTARSGGTRAGVRYYPNGGLG